MKWLSRYQVVIYMAIIVVASVLWAWELMK
jgi:hypothetical protein